MPAHATPASVRRLEARVASSRCFERSVFQAPMFSSSLSCGGGRRAGLPPWGGVGVKRCPRTGPGHDRALTAVDGGLDPARCGLGP